VARIVVVEDNPDNMKLFRALLVRHGHEVTGLATGEGLTEAVRGATPALVLLDIQLPERDGYELLADLRTTFGRDLRVVALTAHAAEADRARALDAGFDGYITKPIDVAGFPALIAQAIDGTLT
jgi:two-component system, cell cycle response regulator DivK